VKKRVLLFFCVVNIFINGCSFKNGFFSQDLIKESLFTNTKKLPISQNSTILVSYLNNSLKAYQNDKENFLINLYIDNSYEENETKNIFDPFVDISIDPDIKPIRVIKLSKDHNLTKISPMQSRWSKYYLVEFNKTITNKIELIFKIENSSFYRLIFLKDQ